MPTLTGVVVGTTATTITPAAMSTADQITRADVGMNGALINVINASGAPVNFTVVDPGSTPAGNTVTAPAQAVPAGADRWFKIRPEHVNNSDVANVTLSSATSVTYRLIKLG